MSKEPDRLVSIATFTNMVGLSRPWFYRHAAEPGMPKRVYVGGKPMLSLAECQAYIERLKTARGPARRRGRPRKQPTLAAQ